MLKIVIVEDEAVIRKGLVYTVDWASMGCVVVGEAGDGLEGLDIIKKSNPDVVITDVKMPHINGLDMVRKLKKSIDFETIIISGYEDFKFAKKAIDLDVFKYILKPIDEDKLKDAIKELSVEIKKKKDYLYVKKTVKDMDNLKLLNMELYLKKEDQYSRYVNRIIEHIIANYESKISLEDLSEELLVSVSYLARVFKESTGLTFTDFLNKYRIQKSLEYIEKNEDKIYKIAHKVGFSEYRYFISVFKKYIGYSPSEFIRKQCIFKGKDE